MSRRSVAVALSAIVALVVGGTAVLAVLIRHEPARYAEAPLPEEPVARQERSREFTERLLALINSINGDREWDEQFTDEQINSYLDDGFIRSGTDQNLLPEGISRPRIVFGTDSVHLAFRYGTGVWSTVVSIDLHVWVPKCEPNVVAMELVGFHAGALPISTQSLLERVAEVGRQKAVDIAWYRTNGHPVALLRFGADQPRVTVVLDSVKLQPGSLTVKGHAIETSAASAMLPAPELQPPEIQAAAR
jgi:hypothetical protein